MAKKSGARDTANRARLFVYSLGFIFQKPVRRILMAHGWGLKLGLPLAGNDAIAVWGRKPVSKRGFAVARRFKKPVVTVEDAFLRSVLTGREGEAPLGLIMDETGVYFDTASPSDLDGWFHKSLALSKPELQQAIDNMALIARLKLSKYNNYSTDKVTLPKGYILVIDQSINDAAITLGGADADSFSDMLAAAKAENPDKKILIKTHPETLAGKRQGYFCEQDCDDQVGLITAHMCPADLFEKALKVYCVTSQMGMEAIFAGLKPVVFGRPFYAGLGLSDDRGPKSDRGIALTPAQMFWATHMQYSKWYDPYFDRATGLGQVATILHARARQHAQNQTPAICVGMRLWKRGFLRAFLSGGRAVPIFTDDPLDAVEIANRKDGRVLVWAGKESQELTNACALRDVPLIRVEDGFLRSVGLGAQLVAPVSLAFDNTGIYYDPTCASQLEHILNASDTLSDFDLKRAGAVQDRIIALKMTKYNVADRTVKITAQKGQTIILVPGQVEDDASIQKGAGQIKSNLQLLQAVRQDFPDAYIIYKPHPDVEAGLRVGGSEADKYADIVAAECNMAVLLEQVNRVATITSLAGFEALLRGKAVTCYGNPFYSGWGLTDDRADKINRRKARPSLTALIHACLIEYPRYWDPVTGKPCPVEVVLERFERGQMGAGTGAFVRILAKLQGLFASYAHLWR
ncbi:MAG: capsular polysaccharide biosynthesis protein [Amylibacter sp.]|nr:capsular polysaccharide biosynthesis protein [Amylibacter sp.]